MFGKMRFKIEYAIHGSRRRCVSPGVCVWVWVWWWCGVVWWGGVVSLGVGRVPWRKGRVKGV
jgi:hypothetical protein